MAELRFNPLTQDWVMIASHRQNRPQMPKGWCPFCPGSGKVPDHFSVYKYDNDFPALSQNPPMPDDVATNLFKTRESYGKCEVILYSPEHTVTLPELPVPHIRELVDLWTERYAELSKDEKITVEYKTCQHGVQEDVYETVCSFSNRYGGYIIMGAEDTGVPYDHLALCDEWIKIPLFGNIESLNVSVAAGILIYEAVKQRGFGEE